ncbi:MAG TPA: peptidase domain-containing ABC transporter [Burkholderiaceae bacterium]|nr:peptidase domain-containing ABC transporter [Burkholderiaceae bacterium]HPE02798.1 peptidase domain-containing ABC transporter [Burkholderiaceae bacterium]HRZ02498.1 peptidase domain-containing ABC transporter [Burkholderiaceae bacterium]
MLGRRTPVILQSEAPECGIACLAMIASHHGRRTDLSAMRLRLAPSMKGVTFKHIAGIADSLGLASRGVKVPLENLGGLKLPAILHWDMNHFVVLTKVSGRRLTIHDPARGRVVLTLQEASDHYTGVAMEMWPTPAFQKKDERERVSAWQLLGAAAGARGAIVQVLLLSLVLEIFAIAMPFFLQIVVDRVIISRDRDLLTVLGVGFAGLALMIALVTALRGWLGVYISTRMNLQLLDTLFARLTRLPLEWFEKRNIGDIVSRFRSVDAIQRTLTLTFLETAMDGLMVAVTVAVMFFYSAELTLIVLTAAALYAALRFGFYGAQRRATDERLVHEARASTHFIETLRGMMAIKLNLREGERRAAYLNHVVGQTNAEVRTQALAIIQRAANVAIFGIENVAVIWLGALLVLDGRFSVGMLFAFMGFKLLFITRVSNLVDKGIEFRMLDLHAERVADIALAEPEPQSAPGARDATAAGPFEISGRNLGYAYGVEGFVFRGVDFSARPGEVVAIVGPSGAGKTTLVKVLTGLFPPSEGRLSADGRDARDWDRADWRARIGVVMQEDTLFVGTIEDNISFFDPAHDPARVRESARLAQIAEDVEAMPMGYNTMVGSLGVALSGGQKQRVLLARALYRRPQILFLDETFDQLDLAREQSITTGLRQTGIGLVIVSHRPETVRAVDRIVELGKPLARVA